jgi:hypothetical protein
MTGKTGAMSWGMTTRETMMTESNINQIQETILCNGKTMSKAMGRE